jgi:outer membrane lipoprotein-sorting protein
VIQRPAAFLVALALAIVSLRAPAFAEQKKDDPARAAAAMEAAIAALGGPKYLGVTSAIATGVYTPFVQGRAAFPLPFVDTFIYPDKNRTEFGKKKTRVVQSNAGDTGWKYDGARELLTAQEPEEIRQFQRFVRANLDNVLRKAWKEQGVTLRYLGRTEIAPRSWAEGVAVDYPDGLSVEIFFDPQTHLPRISRYREGAESGAAGSLVETHYHDVYLDFGGVMAPRVVDLYRDNVQTARLIYEDIKFNAPVDAGVFRQPASAKDLK